MGYYIASVQTRWGIWAEQIKHTYYTCNSEGLTTQFTTYNDTLIMESVLVILKCV